ncbi:beta-galactosidase [Microvirga sp. 0TCS3.31]
MAFLAIVAAIRGVDAEEAGRLPSGLGVHVQVWHTKPADLERIREFGFGFVRWGISWQAVEKSSGQYDWSSTDAFFERLGRVGLSSIVILATGNSLYSPWLELPSHPGVRQRRVAAPPETDAAISAFSRFAAAAAKRYANRPVTWELWNEPDSPIFWPPAPRPEAYARLVSATCGAMKTAAPQSKVLAPATAALPNAVPEFYRALAASEASACLDGLSMHSYRVQDGRQPDPESVEPDNLASRTLLNDIAARWRDLPMLCTEWGFPTSAVDRTTQWAYLARAYLANLASGVSATVWYEWKDSRDEASNPEAHFGLQTRQGTFKAKPDDTLIKRLLRMKFVGRLETNNALIQALLFRQESTDYVVAWLSSDDSNLTADVSVGERTVVLRNVPTITPGNQIEVSGRIYAR